MPVAPMRPLQVGRECSVETQRVASSSYADNFYAKVGTSAGY